MRRLRTIRSLIYAGLICGGIPQVILAQSHPPALSLPPYSQPDVVRATGARSSATPNALIDNVVSARGIIRAGDRVEISAPLSLKLTSAPFRAGDTVQKGDVLARFDCARLHADLNAQDAAIVTLNIRYKSEQDLAAFGASGDYDVAVARSERDQAKAQAQALRASLKDCQLHAPFNAVIQARHVAAFETPTVGEPIYSLIRAGDHEISVIVPASIGATLNIDDEFAFTLDADPDGFTARIVRIAPDIDPVSQTLELIAKPIDAVKLRPGMSGEARFERL